MVEGGLVLEVVVEEALGDAGCKIAFALDFDYAGRLGGGALKLGFQGLAGRMVDDFCREAERVYG